MVAECGAGYGRAVLRVPSPGHYRGAPMPANLDANIDVALQAPEFFISGRSLSLDELAVIRLEDTWKVALVNNIEQAEQDLIDSCMLPLDPRHYSRLQIEEWFGKERFFLQTRQSALVGEEALLADAVRHRNLVRYRLCYTLDHPGKIALSTGHYQQARAAVDAFLALAERLHPFHYPYYTVLWSNGLLNQHSHV